MERHDSSREPVCIFAIFATIGLNRFDDLGIPVVGVGLSTVRYPEPNPQWMRHFAVGALFITLHSIRRGPIELDIDGNEPSAVCLRPGQLRR